MLDVIVSKDGEEKHFLAKEIYKNGDVAIIKEWDGNQFNIVMVSVDQVHYVGHVPED